MLIPIFYMTFTELFCLHWHELFFGQSRVMYSAKNSRHWETNWLSLVIIISKNTFSASRKFWYFFVGHLYYFDWIRLGVLALTGYNIWSSTGINKVTLIGRVGRDIEVRGTEESPVTLFPLATSQSYKLADGSFQQYTEWHKMAIFIIAS